MIVWSCINEGKVVKCPHIRKSGPLNKFYGLGSENKKRNRMTSKRGTIMKKFLVLLMAMILTFSLAACGATEEEAPASAEPAVEKLTIGVDDTYPPMEYRDENNELVGFDIAFANALAAEMGVEIEFVPTAWDGIFSALNSDKYDMIISSVSITPDRLEGFEFSKPYLSNGQVIVVAPDNDSVTTSEDLAGKKVGVQLETTADIAATKLMDTTAFEMTRYDDIIQTFADMKTGRLDAIVVDYAVAIDYVSKDPDNFKITTAQLTNEPIGVCIKKGNTELKSRVDEAISALQDSGAMVPISEEWLGGNYVTDIDEELR